jgi:hypothetical protein
MGKIAEWSVSGMEQFCLLLVGGKSDLLGMMRWFSGFCRFSVFKMLKTACSWVSDRKMSNDTARGI